MKPPSQTLDRGIRLLKIVCEHPSGISLKQLSEELQLHPPIVHRLVETLEEHSLVKRDTQRRISPAYGLIQLSGSVDRSLQRITRTYLQRLADKLQATAHLMVLVEEREVIAELVVEPVVSRGHIAFSAGHKHSVDQGSGGIAILAGRPARSDDPPSVLRAREDGYAVSEGQVVPATVGVSSPVQTASSMPEASIGISLFSTDNIDAAGVAVRTAAREISQALLSVFQESGTVASGP